MNLQKTHHWKSSTLFWRVPDEHGGGRRALTRQYGHNVAGTLMQRKEEEVLVTTSTAAWFATAGACDVRMDGAMVPVMSNSGSGNKGSQRLYR